MCSSKKSCVCEEKGPLKKRIERMSAHTERWLKGATSGEQALTVLSWRPWGTPHTQSHSVPITPAVSIGSWGGSWFPVLKEARRWNIWAWLTATTRDYLSLPYLACKWPLQTPVPLKVEHKAWVLAPTRWNLPWSASFWGSTSLNETGCMYITNELNECFQMQDPSD